jgi:hypothetical protein
MERYVSQLIEDLQAAKSKKVSATVQDEDGKTTLEKCFDIKHIAFPPADRLSESQINALNEAIMSLLEAHNYAINITTIKNLPAHILYQYFVKQWTTKVWYDTHGLTGLEFCDYNPEECGLYEWCKGTWCEADDDYVPQHYNGIYDDDGNKIDMSTIPIPALCLTCRSYLTNDWEENILCSLTRADSRNEGEKFMCYAYKKRRDL